MSKDILEKMAGSWAGDCKTWFQPNVLADTSAVKGTFKPELDGQFLRHTYESTIEGAPRHGEELIVFNCVGEKFQVSWIDSFHMGCGILFSEGPATDTGFAVRGAYDVGPGQEPWGWRTEYVLADENTLVITAYNIMPDGLEAKAVETVYARA